MCSVTLLHFLEVNVSYMVVGISSSVSGVGATLRTLLGLLSLGLSVEDILLNSIEHFADCIREGRESLTDYRQACRVISILEQADRSMKGRVDKA